MNSSRPGFIVMGMLLVLLACSSPDRSAASGRDAFWQADTSEERENTTLRACFGVGCRWAEVDGILEGTWERVDYLGSRESPVLLPVSEHRLVSVRTLNGGRGVGAHVFDASDGSVEPAGPARQPSRSGSAVVWTGEVVYIGPGVALDESELAPALAFDPDSNTWMNPTVDAVPLGGEDLGPGIWTGTELLYFASGLALDPRTGSWRTSVRFPLELRDRAVTAWTGSELVVWGGCAARVAQCDDLGEGLLTDGAVYTVSSGTWHQMSPAPLPAGANPASVWTGSEVIIHAGATSRDVSEFASYDPAQDRWTKLPNAPFSARRNLGLAYSADSALVFAWGGQDTTGPTNDGAALEVTTSTWLQLPDAPAGTERSGHAVAVIGDMLYIDGGWPARSILTLRPS